MKSILVDALRQANEGDEDHALSDSGSFDAINDDFEATANDAPVSDDAKPVDDELALMETSRALEAPSEPDPAAESTDDDRDEMQGEELPDEDADLAAAEAELYQTTELTVYEADTTHAVTIAGELPRPVVPMAPPFLARFAPLLCLLLAMAVGGVRIVYQAFGTGSNDYATAALTATGDPHAAHTPAIPDSTTGAGETRFPFLNAEAVPDGGGAVQ